MTTNILKIGDIVITNAGQQYSPRMTVKYIDNDYCLCVWYNTATHQFEEYKFPYQMLTKLN